jgi:hypothetical protein
LSKGFNTVVVKILGKLAMCVGVAREQVRDVFVISLVVREAGDFCFSTN